MTRRRRRHRDRVSHDRWLVSYADFITLLFAFFVVMYSTAQVDKNKVTQVAAAIQTAFQQMGAFHAVAGQSPSTAPQALNPPLPQPSTPLSTEENVDLTKLQEDLQASLAEEIAKGAVAMHEGPDGLVISLREMGFFDSGSAGFKPDAEVALSHIAALLAVHPYRIRIEGHTDDVPIHTPQFPSNWELSTARATELVRLLIVKYDFVPTNLSAAGFAEYHPIASNATPRGQAQNRRVDIVVLGEQPPNVPPPPGPPPKPSPSMPK